MQIDWAGRVEPTGVFLARSSDELVGLLQAALDHVPETFVAVLSPERRVLVARGSLLTDRGLDAPAVEGLLTSDIPRGDAFWRLIDPLVDAALLGDTGEMIVQDGDLLVLDVRVGPVRDDDGLPVAVVVVAHDVTARRAVHDRLAEEHALLLESEAKVRASEQLFSVAMQTSSIGVVIVAADGSVAQVNPAFCRMVQYSADDLVGRPIARLTHPDDAAEAEAEAMRVVRGEVDTFTRRKRYLPSDGSTVWAEVSVSALRNGDGSLRHLFVQAVDVTAEVAAHEALTRTAHDFQVLAENASDVVVRVDEHGIITWVSPSVVRILGWDPAQLVGTEAMAMIVPEDREKVLSRGTALLAGERPPAVVARFTTAWGRTVDLSGIATPVRDDDGAVVGQVIGLRDVTAEMAVRRELAHRASHDALTGVVNRDDLLSRLRERLSLPPEEGSLVGLLFCDVDELKWLNDTYGHAVGDEVLVSIARALEGVVRRHDVVARLSGDEFVVLLDRVADTAALDAVVEKCREAVSRISRPDGTPVSISVGGVVADLQEDPDQVIHRADRAMMVDKELGRRTRVRRRGARG